MLKKFNLTNPYSRYCQQCDYIYSKKEKGIGNRVCPRCGADRTEPEKGTPSFTLSRLLKIMLVTTGAFLTILLAGFAFLYFTNEEFASEIRQIRQSRPNYFTIGIDISQTIRPDILSDFKEKTTDRLRQFVGEKAVHYQIAVFGVPGCGPQSIQDVLSIQSPENEGLFQRSVYPRINRISIAFRGQRFQHLPLTTPLYGFLESKLPNLSGQRMIILSDLVNDDIDCSIRYAFPQKTMAEFGNNKQGQIFFFYPKPYLAKNYHTPEQIEELTRQQNAYIDSVKELVRAGKLRAYFYQIPDDPIEGSVYLAKKLQDAIPATTYQIIRERLARIVQTIVYGVRG